MADDAPTPSSSDSARQLYTPVEQYIREAENRMYLPPNTIASIVDDNDFLFVVKMCAVIEPLLRQAVIERVQSFLAFLPVTAIKSETLLKEICDLRVDKLRQIVRDYDAINDKGSDFIDALFKIRNRYAHHIANAHLSVMEICEKIATEKDGDLRLLVRLTGVDDNRGVRREPTLLRIVMYYNFAWLLHAVVQLAKPPPQPPPELLGKLMAREQPDT